MYIYIYIYEWIWFKASCLLPVVSLVTPISIGNASPSSSVARLQRCREMQGVFFRMFLAAQCKLHFCRHTGPAPFYYVCASAAT